MIVPYDHWGYYCVEALVALLFAAGIWASRRSRFFWMAFSWFAFDMFVHIVLGFGINEVYIMTAQWAFIIPLAMAYLLRSAHGRMGVAVRAVTIMLALWLWVTMAVSSWATSPEPCPLYIIRYSMAGCRPSPNMLKC